MRTEKPNKHLSVVYVNCLIPVLHSSNDKVLLNISYSLYYKFFLIMAANTHPVFIAYRAYCRDIS